MSAVIPNDLTCLVRDPTKCDAWVEGERGLARSNHCEEITLPLLPLDHDRSTVDNFCRLGIPQSLADFMTLANYIHMNQVHAKFRRLIDHPKIINSSYSGATPDQLMPALDAEALAVRLISEHEEDLTQLDNVLGVLTSTYLQESIQLFGSFAANNSLKEQGLMQATSSVLSKSGPGYVDPHHPDANHSGEAELRCGAKVPVFHGDIPMNFKLPDGGFKPGDLSSIGTVTSDDVSKLGSLLESVDGAKAFIKHPKLKSLDQVRKPKRKKSKPKSAHIPNMNNHSVKRALGATILMKLGQVQRDTSDAYKRAMLKELPAADLLEMATGEKLPDYQANLINSMQAKADPTAPVVERMSGGIPLVATELDNGITVLDELAYIPTDSNESLGRGLTKTIVYYDDGIELTNEQRQTLLEAREGGTDILLADGNTIKFTLDADDPDPLATIEQVQKIYLTEEAYTTDVYAAKHLATASPASFSQGQSEIMFFGGVDRKDIRLSKDLRYVVVHYEAITNGATDLLGCPIEALEPTICNLDFWIALQKDLCGVVLPQLDDLFESSTADELVKLVHDQCVSFIISYVANNA